MKYQSIAVATVLSAVVACGTSNAPAVSEEAGTLPAPAPVDASVDSAPRRDAAPEAAAPKPAPEPQGDECVGTSDRTSCVSCCMSGHPSGASTYFAALIKCMCVADNCQTDCASTVCGPAPGLPDATCQACLTQKTSLCVPDIKAACSPDPECVAFSDCSTKADCLSKP